VAINAIIAARAAGNQGGGLYAGYVSLSGMPAATGITFPGTVAKYTPVTEEMLLNPPATDWLMHYQNYAGWSHSPLKQINTTNVRNLQLRWVWSLDDGERQQITPLVHDGVMFISTAVNNKVQAPQRGDRRPESGKIPWDRDWKIRSTQPARAMVLYGNQLFIPRPMRRCMRSTRAPESSIGSFKHTDFGHDKIGGLMIADGKLIVGAASATRLRWRTAASSPPMTSRTATRSGNSPPSPMRASRAETVGAR